MSLSKLEYPDIMASINSSIYQHGTNFHNAANAPASLTGLPHSQSSVSEYFTPYDLTLPIVHDCCINPRFSKPQSMHEGTSFFEDGGQGFREHGSRRVWTCCHCDYSPNVQRDDYCVECSHLHCTNCTSYSIKS